MPPGPISHYPTMIFGYFLRNPPNRPTPLRARCLIITELFYHNFSILYSLRPDLQISIIY